MLRLVVLLSLTLSGNLWAQTPAKTPPAKPSATPAGTKTAAPAAKSSTQVYEQEDSEGGEKEAGTKTLNAKVKVVRDDGDGREVFFTSDKVSGAFYLRRSVEHYGRYLKLLEDSKKPQGPAVSIRYDDNQVIKSVESPLSGKSSAEPDPNSKWDYGDVPE